MTDQPKPDAETPGGSQPFNLNAPRPTGRPIYESNLLPARKRRRLPPWLVIPSLLLILSAALYFLIFAPKPRRAVATAGQVVYSAADRTAPSASHLWIVPSGGGSPRPLTTGSGEDTSPVFTSDGYQLAFLSNRAGGQNQIYVVDADGKNLTQVTRTAGAKTHPAFAPGSSTLLGFLSGGTLSYADVGQGDATLLLPNPGQSSHSSSTDPTQAQEASSTVVGYDWKPGGDHSQPGLAAVLETSGVQTLAILPTLGSAPKLTQNDQPDGPPLAAGDAVSPAWAPDGSRMAVALLHVLSAPGQPKVSGMVTLDAQGGPVSRLFLTPPGSPSGPDNPVFSPDGSQIAFELWSQPDLASRRRRGLFVVSADGGRPRLLVKGDAGQPQFSRDSRQIFFLSPRAGGGHDLCRINADGSNLLRVSDGRADVTGYALSPQAARP